MSDQMYTHEEMKLAQLPHQLFVFNTIGNHVLLTVMTISVAMSSPLWTLIIPSLSLLIISYTFLRGRTLIQHESTLVRCHWGIVMRRTKIFLIGYIALAIAATLGVLLHTYTGVMKELLFALVGGLGLLPFMVLILTLTILESDTLNHANKGFVADSLIKRWGSDAEKAALAAAELSEA